MTARTYLSIGDVLTLLREEFPDVTISKIRFLESQGLVNPERSPSGYRKFFEGDVERLRWVLRQQREHFLPLKVIRERLDNGDWIEGEGAAGASESAPADPVVAAAAAAAAAPVGAAPVAAAAAASGAPANGKVTEQAHVGSSHSGPSGPSGPSTPSTPSTHSVPSPPTTPSGSGGRARTVGAISAAGAAAAAAATATSPRTPEQSAQAGDEAMARILADASRRTSRVAEGDQAADTAADAGAAESAAAFAAVAAGSGLATHTAPSETETSGPPTAQMPRVASNNSALPRQPISAALPPPGGGRGQAMVPSHQPSAAASRGPAPSGGAGVVSGATPDAAAAAAAGAPPSSAGPDGGANAQGPPEKATGRAAGKAAAGSGEKGGSSTTSMVTGASLTSQELCAASGLSEIELAGLQGFGLIEPVMVAGIPTFDEDALTVANLAAEFRKFGIEARHLRPYRNAVDREMGLIEQVIIPLLRQRNPESRQRAVAAADELGALGQTMRATLMRSALKRHVGG